MLNPQQVIETYGWIFHVDDIFDRDSLLDLLGYVHPIVRLKGVFRCKDNWWSINRSKDTTSYAPSAYRRGHSKYRTPAMFLRDFLESEGLLDERPFASPGRQNAMSKKADQDR